MRLCACVLWSGNLFAWGASSRCYCDLGWFSLLLMPASTCNLFLCVASLPLWLFASTYLLANVARTSNKSDKDVCSRFSWKTCMRCRRRAHRTNFDKIIPFIWARQILILQSADGLAEKFATTQRLHVHTNMVHYGSCITLQWHELLIMLMCKKSRCRTWLQFVVSIALCSSMISMITCRCLSLLEVISNSFILLVIVHISNWRAVVTVVSVGTCIILIVEVPTRLRAMKWPPVCVRWSVYS